MSKFKAHATTSENPNWTKLIQRQTDLYSRTDDIRSPFAIAIHQ